MRRRLATPWRMGRTHGALRLGCALAFAAIAGAPAVARGDDAPYRPSEVERAEPPHAHRLDNGLTVIISPSHRAPRVAMLLRYDAGARREAPEHPGVASLAFHAVHDGGAHSQFYWSRVATLGPSEYTSASHLDDAVFTAVVAPDAVEGLLWLWSDQMGFGQSSVTAEALQRGRTIDTRVREELDATRASCVEDLIDGALHPEGHPYAKPQVATRRAIEGVRLDDVRDFVSRHFGPRGAILTLVGDVEEDVVMAQVKRYFGDLPASPVVAEPPLPVVRLVGQKTIDVKVAGEGEPELILAWPTAALSEADDTALDVLAEILDGERTSYLRYALITEQKLATRVVARQRSSVLGSVFEIHVLGRAGVAVSDLVTAVDGVLRDLGTRMNASAVKLAAGEIVRRTLTKSDGAFARSGRIAMFAATTGDPAFQSTVLRRVMTLTPASLADVLRRQLPLDRRLIARVTSASGAPTCGALVQASVASTTTGTR